jgi:hypothetical protein
MLHAPHQIGTDISSLTVVCAARGKHKSRTRTGHSVIVSAGAQGLRNSTPAARERDTRGAQMTTEEIER